MFSSSAGRDRSSSSTSSSSGFNHNTGEEEKQGEFPRQCICHLRSLRPDCAYNQQALVAVAVPPNKTTTLAENAGPILKHLRAKPKDFIIDYDLPVSALQGAVRSLTKCLDCTERSLAVLHRLANNAGEKLYVELPVLDGGSGSGQVQNKLVLVLTNHTLDTFKVKSQTQAELKAKRQADAERVPSSRASDERALFLHLCTRAKSDVERCSLPPQGSSRIMHKTLEEEIGKLRLAILQHQQQDIRQLVMFTRKYVRQVEEMVLTLRIGFSYTSTHGGGMPSEMKATLHAIKYKEELDMVEGIVGVMSMATRFTSPVADVLLLLLSLAQRYVQAFTQNLSNEKQDVVFSALDAGRRLYSTQNNSYVFSRNGDALTTHFTLMDITDLALTWLEEGPGTGTLSRRLDSIRTNAGAVMRAHIPFQDLVSKRRMLEHFAGTLLEREEEAKMVNSKNQPARNVMASVRECYGLGKIPVERLDEMAAEFWADAAASKREELVSTLRTLCQSSFCARGVNDASVFFRNACGLVIAMHRVVNYWGDLDWLLARLSLPPFCTAMDVHEENASFPLQHVVAHELYVRTMAWMEQDKKDGEALAKEQAAIAAKAQEDLLREEEAESSLKAAAKLKKRKPQAPPTVAAAPSSSPPNKKRADDDAASQAPPTIVEPEVAAEPSAAAAETAASWEQEEEEEDAWKEVVTQKKKPVAPPASSAGSVVSKLKEDEFDVTWQSRTSCTVRTTNNNLGFIMGEGGKRISMLVKDTSADIKAVPGNKSPHEPRFFQIKAKTAEQCQRAVDALRQAIESQGDVEHAFAVRAEHTVRILGERGKNLARLQRDTKCYVNLTDCVPPRANHKWIVIRGPSAMAVKKCAEQLSRFAVDAPAAAAAAVAALPPRVEVAVAEKRPETTVPDAVSEEEQMEEAIQASLREAEQAHIARRQQEEEAALLAEHYARQQQQQQEEAMRNAFLSEQIAKQEQEDALFAKQIAQEEQARYAQEQAALPAPAPPQSVVAAAPPKAPAPPPASTVVSEQQQQPQRVLLQDYSNSFTVLAKQRKDANSVILTFPFIYLGRVMGAQSRTIKDVERECKVTIETIKTPDEAPRKLLVRGPQDCTEAAYRRIKALIGEDKTYVLPSQQLYGKLAQHRSPLMDSLEAVTRTKIYVHPVQTVRPPPYLVTITAPTREPIAQAKFFLECLVEGASMAKAKELFAREQERRKNDTTGLKGLSNMRGENSCFLNVVVQSLFHFDKFSRELMSGDSRSYNALASSLLRTFRALAMEDAEFVNSSELREAVSQAFEGDFELGQMDDAVEAFDRVLTALHDSLTGGKNGAAPKRTPGMDEVVCDCIVHRNFASYMFQGVSCPDCKMQHATAPNWPQVISYVAAFELINTRSDLPFAQRLRMAMTNVQPRSCPKCDREDRKLPLEIHFTKTPAAVFSLGVSWSVEQPDLEREVKPVLEMIEQDLDLSAIFPFRTPHLKRRYKLRGVICFSHKHYIAMFRKRNNRDWFEFDDQKVKPIGPSWKHAYTALLQKRFHPVIFFFEDS